MEPVYKGEILLRGWGENAHDGMWIRLQLDDTPGGFERHPFRGYQTGQNGQRFMVAIVPIGDDEQPEGPKKPKISWYDMPRSQRAGILCGDEKFLAWLGLSTPAAAANVIYVRCGVISRRELDADEISAGFWDKLEREYRVHAGLETAER